MDKNSGNRVAIIGATGYGGFQAVRLLANHPVFNITFLGGERSAGKSWNLLNPFMPLPSNPLIERPNAKKISECADIAILSLPNGLAAKLVPELLKQNVKVIDLSADYRYRSLDQWKEIYYSEASSLKRNDMDLCNDAVYGLSEWNESRIKKAQLVSCPGCFPTSSLLPLLPFINQGLIEINGIIIDAKTGTSGGGRNPKEVLLLSESSESIAPYGVIGHRHTSEIEQEASLNAGHKLEIQFTPHLVPMVRGILSTVYSRLRDPGLTAEDCRTVLKAIYRTNKCIEILPVGVYPSTKWVRNTNKALISVQVDRRNGRLILMCAIDNLMKGQAGQAIQNLNIMNELDETCGLPLTCFYP